MYPTYKPHENHSKTGIAVDHLASSILCCPHKICHRTQQQSWVLPLLALFREAKGTLVYLNSTTTYHRQHHGSQLFVCLRKTLLFVCNFLGRRPSGPGAPVRAVRSGLPARCARRCRAPQPAGRRCSRPETSLRLPPLRPISRTRN